MARNPEPGKKVLICFGDTNLLAEVIHPYDGPQYTSADGFHAVSVPGILGVITHKYKGDGVPYWEWPA